MQSEQNYLQNLLDQFILKYESKWAESNKCSLKTPNLDGTVTFMRHGLFSSWKIQIDEPFNQQFIIEL